MQSLSAPSAPADTALDSLEVSLAQASAGVESIPEAVSPDLACQTLAIEISNQISTEIPNEISGEIPEQGSEEAPAWKLHLQVFTSTFVTIFLAELGDKTQVTTLLMAAESHAPWVVFAGAGAALIATSAIGVWLGCWLAKRVSPQVLERSVGILLLGVSALLVLDVVRG